MEAFLNEDISSVLKGKVLYGKKGDKVTVISIRGDIAIVSGPRWIEGEEARKRKLIQSGIHNYSVNINDTTIK